MPSLFRFLIIVIIFALLGFLIMLALSFVNPQPREMSSRIPSAKLQIEQSAPTDESNVEGGNKEQ